MKIERKTFSAAEFKATDPAQGIAEMIVSVFGNVDGGNEVVCPGFFAESIAQRRTADGRPKAKGVWGHDWTTPIAKTLDARELYAGDPLLPPQLKELGGLWVKGQFNLDTQRGREAFSDLQGGYIDEFSIGYSVNPDGDQWDGGVRKLRKGQWYEWSPVLVGMNDRTALLSTKNANDPETRFKAADFATTFQQALSAEQLQDARYDVDRAWRVSFNSIIEDQNIDLNGKLALIRASGAQYIEALAQWAAKVLAIAPTMTSDIGYYGLGDAEHKGQPYAEQAAAVLAAAKALVGRSQSLVD